jgi:hypothetical protein
MNQKNGLVPYGEPSKFLNVAIVVPHLLESSTTPAACFNILRLSHMRYDRQPHVNSLG